MKEIQNFCLIGIHNDTACLEILASLKNQEHLQNHLKEIKRANCSPFIVNTEKAKEAWGTRVLDYKTLID